MSGLRKTVTMLNNTGEELNVYGKAIRADSYFGYTDGLHTVQAEYFNFTGGIGIQGTLSLGQTCDGKVTIPDEDWFWINLTDQRGNCSQYPYMIYPKDPLNPTGHLKSNPWINPTGDSGTEAFTFVGNFTYLRAVVTREYMEPEPTPTRYDTFLYGQVNRILLSL